MLPPPSSPGQPATPEKQRAGLAVLVVALVTLLGIIAMVWWANEQNNDDDPFRSRLGAVAVAGSPT